VGFKLDIAHNEAGGYLAYTVAGPWTLQNTYALIDSIKQETGRHGVTRVLVDMRATEGLPSDMDRYKWGVRAAEVLGGRVRVAVLGRSEQINRFGENTAVNRGADVNTLTDPDEALRWLTR